MIISCWFQPILIAGATKFVRRKKPEPPVLDSVPASKIGAIYLSDASSPLSHLSEKNEAEIESNTKPVSGGLHSEEIMVGAVILLKDAQVFSFFFFSLWLIQWSWCEKHKLTSFLALIFVWQPAYHKDIPKDFTKHLANPKDTNQEEKNGSHKVFPITYADDTGGFTPSNGGSMDSSDPHSNEYSDEDDIASVVSESRVSVGRYHVKESFAPILRSIFNKYGDIGENCHLESVAMRSYYVECVCFVVQELQAISTMEFTKSKLKELLAILKDVESAEVRVTWLHSILEEVAENMELINKRHKAEIEKANCDHEAESLKKELELDLEDLAQKEQEVADVKARIMDTQDRLKELELKSSELEKTMISIKAEVGKLDSKSLLDELL